MGIARTYGVTLADLRRENGIRGDRLLVGQTIRIP
jgi:LysM repeat protein